MRVVSVFTRAGEPGVFGSLEPEPAEKKTRSWSRSKTRRKLNI